MIRITRSQSIVIAGGTIVAFFVAVAIASRDTSAPPRAQPGANPSPAAITAAAAPTDETAGSSKFMLENFHRRETKDGRTIWEVTAKRGRYIPESQRAYLESALVWLFRKNDEKVKVSADRAELVLTAGALQRADLIGNVTLVQNGQVTVETAHALYDLENKRVTSEAAVKVTSERMEISGDKLEVNLEDNSARITGNVRTYIPARKAS